MKRLWAVSALSLMVIAGCSDNANVPLDAAGHYEKSCSACHDSDLKGAPSGPPVLDMKSKYTEEDLLTIIQNGKGMMPANLLEEEDAKLVTKWLLEK